MGGQTWHLFRGRESPGDSPAATRSRTKARVIPQALWAMPRPSRCRPSLRSWEPGDLVAARSGEEGPRPVPTRETGAGEGVVPPRELRVGLRGCEELGHTARGGKSNP